MFFARIHNHTKPSVEVIVMLTRFRYSNRMRSGEATSALRLDTNQSLCHKRLFALDARDETWCVTWS